MTQPLNCKPSLSANIFNENYHDILRLTTGGEAVSANIFRDVTHIKQVINAAKLISQECNKPT